MQFENANVVDVNELNLSTERAGTKNTVTMPFGETQLSCSR